MKMYFEWAWMNHKDHVELLRQLVVVSKTLEGPWNPSLVHETIKWRIKWHKSNTKKTFEPQNIKSQGSKMKKKEVLMSTS